jgi:hypothetical protein
MLHHLVSKAHNTNPAPISSHSVLCIDTLDIPQPSQLRHHALHLVGTITKC